MIKQDIPLYKLDLTGKSEFNHVKLQAGSRFDAAQHQIVIPPGAPFYQKSMKITDPSGKLLVLGEDYEFYGIMNKLTAFTAQPVGLFIRFLKDEIREWVWDYQVVGNFNKLTSEILNMLHSIYEDDRYVFWENIKNKPLWFDPEVHQHDLVYDIFGFTDLARELNRIAHIQGTQKAASDGFLEAFRDHIDFYCKSYRELLQGMINNHGGHKYDQHAVRKEHIGLALVDDYATATLEETLEGLRDDLFITPYNAALAVSAAAGRNDKLYPSGKLPLLRYGSDTFIPPTIGGSFEGLGGVTSRCGAIVESDGTLLILKHRNNGKLRGLYFTRCSNWRSTSPDYEFTSYMYTHPTATAAGATLDSIIGGSNRHIMVVGDAKKNLWWWCETRGSFNPDTHILIPFTGPWVTEDMANINVSDIYNLQGLASVCADENYKDRWCIVQGYPLNTIADRFRRGRIPNYDTMGNMAWGGGAMISGGFSINVVNGNTIYRADIDFTHPIAGNFNDKIWSPVWPELIDENGQRKVKSYYCQYDPPVRSIQNYNSPRVFWRKLEKENAYALRIDTYGREFTFNSGASGGGWGRVMAYKGKVTFAQGTNGIKAYITAAPDQAVIQKVNPESDPMTWTDYIRGWYSQVVVASQDQTGIAQVADDVAVALGGTGNVSFPPSFSVFSSEFLKTGEKMLEPDYSAQSISWYHKWKRINEANPIGMGSMFSNQRLILGDNNTYTTAGVMVKQLKVSEARPDGYAELFYRPMGYMGSNWEHIAPTQVSSFDGKAMKHYPFVSDGAVVSGMGLQVPFNGQAPIPGGNQQVNKDIFKYLFGASSSSRLMGLTDYNENVNIYAGWTDWKLVWESATTLVGKSPTFTPVKVVHLKTAFDRDIKPIFKNAGLSDRAIDATWTMARVLNPNGVYHTIWKAFQINMTTTDVESVVIVSTTALKGTPTTVDGYQYYTDLTINILASTPKVVLETHATSETYILPKYDRAIGNTTGFTQSIPYKSRNGATVDRSSYFVEITPDARWPSPGGQSPSSSMLEISADGRTILSHIRGYIPEWGSDVGHVPMPYYGIGNAAGGAPSFEGSAVACNVPDLTQGVWNAMNRGLYESQLVVGMSNILIPQFTVYFSEIKNILLAGKMYDIPATYIDIRDQDPSPANKTYYVYVHYANNIAEYVISPTVRPESSVQSMIAKITCGPTQIDTIIPYNRFSMNGVVISAKRQGSAILASSGSSEGVGDTSNILLNSDFIS